MPRPSEQAQQLGQFLAAVRAAWAQTALEGAKQPLDPLVKALVDEQYGRAIYVLALLELADDAGLVCALLRAAGRCGAAGGRLVTRNALLSLLQDPAIGIRDAVVGLCEACQLQDLAGDLGAAAEVEPHSWLADKMRAAAAHLKIF